MLENKLDTFFNIHASVFPISVKCKIYKQINSTLKQAITDKKQINNIENCVNKQINKQINHFLKWHKNNTLPIVINI